MAASARERFVGALSNRLLRIYFRRLEVIGADRLPRGGPRVVVANHVNGLLDPMFVFGPLGIPARMLGKATLWRIPGIAQLADLAGGIPIQRRQDPGADPAKNVEAFAAAHDVLAAGGAIAVFPEGISHDQPRLQPLRTGAARIVLEAERRYPTRGPLGVRIVPIGLVFERREKFRSRALVVVGEPLDPAPEIAAAREDERAAVRALTERIAAALEAVTLNYESWEEARLVALGADVVVRERDGGRRPLGREFELRRTLVAALARLRASHPADVAEAVEAGRSYERLLRAARLDDAHVAARVGWSPALRFLLVALARLLLASPLALVGTALNLVPWLVVDLVSRFVRDEPNQISTYRLFPGLLLYPAAWIAAAVVAGRALGAASGVGVGLVAPLAGWVALRWHERRRALWRETRAFLLLRGRRSVAGELRARRARVEQAIERLAGYLSGSDSASSRA